ncbi:hypothetical protein [Sinomicrobium soli]|uniref:hypothetical protein n=1 Tax=Sinomicrobium sp. N-1-3-6 TaxID=2219864 RepID=UPI000DCE1FB5|nr:hypothetical protein [Sinomicrobium sp. N-1-3-6]RAV30791.1 hypothetical protein DN748_00590 [Sinomicrobium sp. N-1-3-6]
MLLCTTCNDSRNRKKIENSVGKPYTLDEREKLQGVHSPVMEIVSSSLPLRNLLILNPGDNNCTLELRPRGIILYFSSVMGRHAFVIPYYKLSIRKINAGTYGIHKDNYRIGINVINREGRDFIKKILRSRTDSLPFFADDL